MFEHHSNTGKIMKQEKKDLSILKLREKLKDGLNKCKVLTNNAPKKYSQWIYDNKPPKKGYGRGNIYKIMKGTLPNNVMLKNLVDWLPDFIEYLLERNDLPEKRILKRSALKPERVRDFAEIKNFIFSELDKQLENNPNEFIKISAMGIKLSSLYKVVSSREFQKKCRYLDLTICLLDPESDNARDRIYLENLDPSDDGIIPDGITSMKLKVQDWIRFSKFKNKFANLHYVVKKYDNLPSAYLLKINATILVSPYLLPKGNETFFDIYSKSKSPIRFSYYNDFLNFRITVSPVISFEGTFIK